MAKINGVFGPPFSLVGSNFKQSYRPWEIILKTLMLQWKGGLEKNKEIYSKITAWSSTPCHIPCHGVPHEEETLPWEARVPPNPCSPLALVRIVFSLFQEERELT